MSDENLMDISSVDALENSEGESVETSAVLAYLKNKQGTIIVPYVNEATSSELGVVQVDGTTIVANDGVISAVGGGGSSDGVGIPPSNCTALRKSKNGTTYSLKWRDPDDTVIDGFTLCTWAKTYIVRKEDDFPADIDDGDIVCTNITRNAYNSSEFTDDPGEGDFYYRAFPVSANGAVNLDPHNKFGSVVYEFVINQNDSNPKTSVTYCGANAEFTPAYMDYTKGEFNYGSWKDAFFMGLFRPCMLNPDGTVKYYLNPDDYSVQADGVTPSEIADTSQTANAMVEVDQIWIKEENVNGRIHVSIANEQISSDYDCFTHLKPDGTYNEHYYRAIYDGSNISNKIRSLSGQAICKNVAGNTQIAYAQANGTGWNVDEWNFRRLINYLLILMGKSLDTQTVFGTGRYSGGSSSSNNQLNTGTMDSRGMFYGDNANGGVKVFYMENWWGNIWKITNGIIQKSGKMLYKMCEGTLDGSTVSAYNTDGTGYIDSGVTNSGTITQQHLRNMTLVPHLGLVPTNTGSGSTSTYYCDSWWSNSSVVGFARFGGTPYNGLSVGAFAFTVDSAVSHSVWTFGVALSYKKAS